MLFSNADPHGQTNTCLLGLYLWIDWLDFHYICSVNIISNVLLFHSHLCITFHSSAFCTYSKQITYYKWLLYIVATTFSHHMCRGNPHWKVDRSVLYGECLCRRYALAAKVKPWKQAWWIFSFIFSHLYPSNDILKVFEYCKNTTVCLFILGHDFITQNLLFQVFITLAGIVFKRKACEVS